MTDFEIPYEKDRTKRYRFFEILPGFLSWFLLCLPLILSLINVTLASIFILAYLLIFFARAMGVNVRAFQGYKTLDKHRKLPWRDMFEELKTGVIGDGHGTRPKWHAENLERLKSTPATIKPDDIVHVIMIATYNESREVVEPTIQSVIESDLI